MICPSLPTLHDKEEVGFYAGKKKSEQAIKLAGIVDEQKQNLLLLMKPVVLINIMIFFLVIVSDASAAAPKNLDSVGVYWGQDGPEEGTLRSACNTDRYSHVIVASLTNLGTGRTPKLNFTGHCNPTNYTCNMSDDIRFCQKSGIKVMLAIVSDPLSSRDDAKNVSMYLWNNFLSGRSESRPFGDAVLDGIQFMIQQQDLPYYDDLAKFLSNYNTSTSSSSGNRLYLGAAHPCPTPGSTSMGSAINTALFDFVSIESSYSTTNSRQCDYNGNIGEFMNSWETWTTMIPAGKIYLGLPASPQVAESGFIPADVLKSEILPVVTKSARFGGVMVWSKFWDDKTGYTDQINTSVR
ncbi:hevamine-A-like [Impatiens glandulifera]|uniref:hevamine-A-like n=1 Tax=Impatiens glandulifera TaxID=253017 RepID=UPI001FB18693|nr:hevamine-A-like [Impatiens glandulifera]